MTISRSFRRDLSFSCRQRLNDKRPLVVQRLEDRRLMTGDCVDTDTPSGPDAAIVGGLDDLVIGHLETGPVSSYPPSP